MRPALSPYAGYLDHGDWTNPAKLAADCLSFASFATPGDVALSVLAWLVMCWAMMVPVAQLSAKVSAYLVYFTVWLGYGLLAHAAGVLLVSEVFLILYYLANGWVAGVILIAVSGAWMAVTPDTSKASAQSGLSAALACIVACGPTMTLMFAFFPGNPLWMAVIAGTMYAGRYGSGRNFFIH